MHVCLLTLIGAKTFGNWLRNNVNFHSVSLETAYFYFYSHVLSQPIIEPIVLYQFEIPDPIWFCFWESPVHYASFFQKVYPLINDKSQQTSIKRLLEQSSVC